MLHQIQTIHDDEELEVVEKPADAPLGERRTETGVNLEYVETILLKFFLASYDEIPKGIKYQKREKQTALDSKHAVEASNEGLDPEKVAMRARIRPGHVDTGELVYNEIENVSLPTFAEGALRNDLYGIEEPHWFKQKIGKTELFVVVFAFVYGKPSFPKKEKVLKQLEALASDRWTVSVWDNPNLTTTTNCTRRVRAKRPSDRRAVVGRNRLRIFYGDESK